MTPPPPPPLEVLTDETLCTSVPVDDALVTRGYNELLEGIHGELLLVTISVDRE